MDICIASVNKHKIDLGDHMLAVMD